MKTKHKIKIAEIISLLLKPFYKKNKIHIRNRIKWYLYLIEITVCVYLLLFQNNVSEFKI